MNSTMMTIRPATLGDAPALLQIYTPYVTDTAITFESDVPTAAEFAKRMMETLAKYPYLVAVQDERTVGYAYAAPFRAQLANAWSVEIAMYVAPDYRHQGIGRRLYEALEEALRAQGFLNVNVCIAYPDGADDEYLLHNGMAFHQHLGYEKSGEFHQCGYKFQRWYNMVWMEKIIGHHAPQQEVPKSFFSMVPRDPHDLEEVSV